MDRSPVDAAMTHTNADMLGSDCICFLVVNERDFWKLYSVDTAECKWAEASVL